MSCTPPLAEPALQPRAPPEVVRRPRVCHVRRTRRHLRASPRRIRFYRLPDGRRDDVDLLVAEQLVHRYLHRLRRLVRPALA